jgi:hypothetical protein
MTRAAKHGMAWLSGLLVVLAVAVFPVAGQAQLANELQPIEITDFQVDPSTTQAGGNPETRILMRFCDFGVPVIDASNASPIVITIDGTFNVTPGSQVQIHRVRGNTAANGVWTMSPVFEAGAPVTNKFILQGSSGNGAYVPDSGFAALPRQFGCQGPQANAPIKSFTIKLAPGVLGDPTSTPACPTFLWHASACPPETVLGHSVTRTRPGNGSDTVLPVPSVIYNIQTLGLEPARLGTTVFPSNPAGPLPIVVTLRTDDPDPDQRYGINSALFGIPRNLGGVAALPYEIDSHLCATVPCAPTDVKDPASVEPLPNSSVPYRPFFRNPTSCKPATSTLIAESWDLETVPDEMSSTFTPTGCENVPFAPKVSVDSTNKSPGASDRQTVNIEYPPYDEDSIWQAAMRDAEVTLPTGMGLAPGGGAGLQECSFEDFGVDRATLRPDNDPALCPEGSHVGDIEVDSPVLPLPLGGKAFFGETTTPGRPTDANPWKLFLLLEGQGVRIKLVGDVTLTPGGQVRTVFLNNPETPFTSFRLKMGNDKRAVLLTPRECGTHTGEARLTDFNDRLSQDALSTPPVVTPEGCTPGTFSVNIDEASGTPDQAGAHSVSRIVISRTDPSDMLKGLKLSLPPGAAGSLSAVAKCPLASAQAGICPESTAVGNIKTSLGSSGSIFTVPGKLYLAEAAQPGDVASIVATVPAKAGVPDASGKYPIDLGPDVVIVNRLLLREADTGVDVILQGAYRGGQLISDGIPTMLEGVPLPIRKIEITVDREGFFLNPTGCDLRTLTGTFISESGLSAVSSLQLQATGCDKLPFDPTLYMIAGERGKTNAGQTVHPPLTAIVTQKAGEAAISRARVLLPSILRPNVPFLNEPGALCSDAQAQARTCPPKSQVGSARVITPVLPFELNGPVHIVQEIGSILPKLYVYLRGGGFEVLLRARNRITGVRTENTFDFVPDVPQSYFELKIKGGTGGLLNNFYDLCDTPADSARRQVEATFNGHNGAVRNSKFALRVEGCGSDIAAARIASARIKVNRKGIAKVRVSCRRKDGRCNGRLAVRAKGVSAAKSFKIPKRKSRTLKLKFSKGEVRKLRRAKKKQMKGTATTSVRGFDAKRRAVTLVFKRR